MKILHVITSLRTGGAEKLMVDLLPRMKVEGNEVDLCVFDGLFELFFRLFREARDDICRKRHIREFCS